LEAVEMTENELIAPVAICLQCERGTPALALHYCPFRWEVDDDKDFECECCEECMEQCSRDI